ncbi:hypothetical protein [Kordia sp.]|uniref:hypothetical protein n=1 Tax=Kordia sp. TaxID=1965332 RepID=UPI003B58DED2
MSRFYYVQAIEVAPDARKIVLSVQVKHTDYNILSDSLGYALDLVSDNLAYEKTMLSEYIDADKMCDKNWIKDNASRFIESCTILNTTKSENNELLQGKIAIVFTHKAWMEHIKLHATWDSTAYEYHIENYKKCTPEVPDGARKKLDSEVAMLKKITINYEKNEGWMPIKSSYLKGNMSKRPAVVYIPRYPFQTATYVCNAFYEGGKALKEMIAVFDLKTVIIKDAYNGPDLFGICVVQGNVILLQSINEQKLEHTVFSLNRIKEIGLATYNTSNEKPLEYKNFLENAKPN